MGNKTPRSQSRSLSAVAFGAMALAAAGCGGGGSSGGGAPTGLAFRVAWEQRANPGGTDGASLSSANGAELGFEDEIPPSVNAIRFVLTPPSGDSCCVAVLRGSPAFEERRIVLSNVEPGDGSLEVNGYPTNFAPADGIDEECDTNGAGSSCSSQETLPSFGSGEIEIDVVANTTNIVNVSVHSLPFLLDLDPDDGETADEEQPHISFTVVDANHDVNEDIGVLITQGSLETGVEFDSIEDCADGDIELPDCSEGGELEVRGVIVETQSQVPLDPGVASLHIEASNTAPIPRSMESDTTFIVPEVTTTTTSSSTTTTEPEPPATFCLEFSVSAPVALLGVSYEVSYGATGGDFTGTGEEVSCFSLLNPNDENTLTSFNDDDGSSTLLSAVISPEPFNVPVALAQCEFLQVPPLDTQAFSVLVTEATTADLTSTTATVSVTETTCPF